MQFSEYKNLFETYLIETNEVSISDIQKLKEPLFILSSGGTASGKSYTISKALHYPIIDVDEIRGKLDGGIYNQKFISPALKIYKQEIDKYLKSKQTVIVMSTSGDLLRAKKKLQEAKDSGFTTVMIFIDTPPAQAIINNKKRVNKGGHGITISDEQIKLSYQKSKDVFNKLKDDTVLDYCVHIKN